MKKYEKGIITKIKNKEEKGITLVALVITIIVLLILAGITIASLSGENGILIRATEAAEKTNTARIEEQIEFAKIESMHEGTLKMQKEKLKGLLEDIEGVDEVIDEENKLIVKYAKGKEQVIELESGNENGGGDEDEKTVLATEEDLKNKIEGSIDLKEDKIRAYDLYGEEIIDFEKNWKYKLASNGSEWELNDDAGYNAREAAYIGEIVDGTFVGEIPAYIVQIEGGAITHQGKVTSYRALFANKEGFTHLRDDLKISPVVEEIKYMFENTDVDKIPNALMTFSDNVTSISGLFGNTKITEIPPEFKIGNKVKEMNSLFEGTLIKKVPKSLIIPDSVKYCNTAFYSCTNLTEVEEGFKFGSGVTRIEKIFKNCSKLNLIKITIPEIVTNISEFLKRDYLLNNNCSITIEGNPETYEEALSEVARDSDTGLNIYYYGSKCGNKEKIEQTLNGGKVTFIDLEN